LWNVKFHTDCSNTILYLRVLIKILKYFWRSVYFLLLTSVRGFLFAVRVIISVRRLSIAPARKISDSGTWRETGRETGTRARSGEGLNGWTGRERTGSAERKNVSRPTIVSGARARDSRPAQRTRPAEHFCFFSFPYIIILALSRAPRYTRCRYHVVLLFSSARFRLQRSARAGVRFAIEPKRTAKKCESAKK